MIDINELVTNNFQDNIEYFEKEHPEVFEKLIALDSAIENKHYEEKYELIYENDYFDVLEKSTHKFLYAQNSNEFAQLVLNSIDTNPKKNTFECFSNILVSKEERDVLREDDEFENHISKFVDILYYTQQNSNNSDNLKRFEKFIFFGIGLGTHIKEFNRKFFSKAYLIVEDDLELFRLSLFTINYKDIALSSKLYFSIFDTDDKFTEISRKFLYEENYYNSHIKYFIMLSHSDSKKSIFHSAVAIQPNFTFHYNMLLTQSIKPLEYIFDNYKFLNKKLLFSDKILDKASFLLLAAGPSLQKNEEWLVKNHSKFIIVAISAILPFLERNGIIPDIIIHLEGASHASKLFENIQSFDFLKKSICFFSDSTPSDVINLFSKKQMFLFEDSTGYKENSIKLIAPCVGSVSFQLLLRLKIKNIYLLGLDLALNEDGRTHIDGHIRSKVLTSNDNISSTKDFQKDLVKVDGNLAPHVFTTLQYKISADAIDSSSKIFKDPQQKIYNLSTGAYFENTNPISPSNLITTDIIKPKNYDFYKLCKGSSTTGLSVEDRVVLKAKFIEATGIKKLINTVQNMTYSTSQEFEKVLIEISSYINDNNNLENELFIALDYYLRDVLLLIFNFFNRDNIEDEGIHIKNLKNLFCKNTLEIIDYYINSLNKHIKK